MRQAKGETSMIETLDALRQHQLVIMRRLRKGPLTEFELAEEIAGHSGYTVEQSSEHMAEWLDELRTAGLVWAGSLSNGTGLSITAAALTKRGQSLVN